MRGVLGRRACLVLTRYFREEEEDDEDGFNDVEEITDDMCEVSHDVSG